MAASCSTPSARTSAQRARRQTQRAESLSGSIRQFLTPEVWKQARQGQRSLNRGAGTDFQHEVVAPTATAAFHGHTFATGMLLQQRQCEASEPCKVFTHVFILNARLILTIGEIETPVTTIFNPPMTANRIGESLHTHRETADGIANLNRLFPVAKALRHHHANRLQTFPQFEPRQAPRHRHLNGASRLVTSMPRLLGHMPTSRHSREVVRALLIDLLDDRLMQRLMVSFQRQHILDYQPCSKFCAGSASRRGRLPAPHLLAGGQSGPPGRTDEARRRFDRLLSIRNDVGLLSEGV